MLNSAVLDVVVGLVFVFIVISTICSAVREGIEAWFKTRGRYLEYGIRQILRDANGKGLAGAFFDHPLIRALYVGEYEATDKMPNPWRSGHGLPSYIPARTFALTLMDIAARGPSTDALNTVPGPATTFYAVRENVSNLDNPAVQRVLLAALDAAQGDLMQAQKNVEAWYDDAMERIAGWYRRSTQWMLLGIALVVVCAFNVNAIRIAEHLYSDRAARELLVAEAGGASGNQSEPVEQVTYQQALQTLDGLRLPIGWEGGWNWYGDRKTGLWSEFFAPVLGLLISAVAAVLGAPFWFDVLNRVSMARVTKKPDPTVNKADAQVPAPGTVVIPAWPDLHGVQQVPGPERVGTRTTPLATTSMAKDAPSETEPDALPGGIEEATADAELPPARGGVDGSDVL